MRFGLGTLKLSPRAFWSMTMPELKAAIDANQAPQPSIVTRGWLADAMTQNPDTKVSGPRHGPT